MNRVNLGEDPGYSESKHPILNIHVHAHGWRGKLSLSHHTPGTQRTGQPPARKENEQSLREAAGKSTRRQLERSQGFTDDVGQRSSDEWLSICALKRAVIVHLLQVGDEQQVNRLRISWVCVVLIVGSLKRGRENRRIHWDYPGPWQLRKDLSPLLEIRHNFSTLISDFGLSLTTLRIFFFDAQIEPSHYT